MVARVKRWRGEAEGDVREVEVESRRSPATSVRVLTEEAAAAGRMRSESRTRKTLPRNGQCDERFSRPRDFEARLAQGDTTHYARVRDDREEGSAQLDPTIPLLLSSFILFNLSAALTSFVGPSNCA